MMGGHVALAQGYLVYKFFVVNAQDHTGHLIIVDAGNGKVLYTSQGLIRPFDPHSMLQMEKTLGVRLGVT
jgi:hypothetical protein